MTPEKSYLTSPDVPKETARRTFICRKCNATFLFYKGMRAYPGGTGLCKQHNPNFKEAR